MLSNSCRYGIRAVVYLVRQGQGKGMAGIKQISGDLKLPTPYLAKILQQLVKKKILVSVKGPNGGFAFSRDPKKVTLLDIVSAIDGDEVLTNCILHSGTCKSVDKRRDPCIIHDEYARVRKELINLLSESTIYNLAVKASNSDTYLI
jgi:Rrf2 family protein